MTITASHINTTDSVYEFVPFVDHDLSAEEIIKKMQNAKEHRDLDMYGILTTMSMHNNRIDSNFSVDGRALYKISIGSLYMKERQNDYDYDHEARDAQANAIKVKIKFFDKETKDFVEENDYTCKVERFYQHTSYAYEFSSKDIVKLAKYDIKVSYEGIELESLEAIEKFCNDIYLVADRKVGIKKQIASLGVVYSKTHDFEKHGYHYNENWTVDNFDLKFIPEEYRVKTFLIEDNSKVLNNILLAFNKEDLNAIKERMLIALHIEHVRENKVWEFDNGRER